MSETPLLTVAIPTYNRAGRLRAALQAVLTDRVGLESKVEVVVSDNCSPDATEEVVRAAQLVGPLRYSRNPRNVGPWGNFVRAAELASGAFLWLVGDDDIICEGAIGRAVTAIEANSNVRCFFANQCPMPASSRGACRTSSRGLDLSRPICGDPAIRRVERWEEIIRLSDSGALFTYIGANIVPPAVYLAPRPAGVSGALEETFPHALRVAAAAVGRPAVYIGTPQVVVFAGEQDWIADWGAFLLVRVPELVDFLERQGVARRLANRFRRSIFREAGATFRATLRGGDKRGRWRGELCVRRMVQRYWAMPSFWLMWVPSRVGQRAAALSNAVGGRGRHVGA